MEAQTIYILHGEDAIDEYYENGIDGCIKKGFNNASSIEVDEQSNLTDVIREVLNRVSGSLDSAIITKDEFEKLDDAFLNKNSFFSYH